MHVVIVALIICELCFINLALVAFYRFSFVDRVHNLALVALDEPKGKIGIIITVATNLIEECMGHHMSKEEVMDHLYVQLKIEPYVTNLIWGELEKQNKEFFVDYKMKLIMNEQQENELMKNTTASAAESSGTKMPPASLTSNCNLFLKLHDYAQMHRRWMHFYELQFDQEQLGSLLHLFHAPADHDANPAPPATDNQQPGSDSGSSSDHQPNPAPPATDNEQPGSDSGSSSDHQPNPAPPATDNEQPGSGSGSSSDHQPNPAPPATDNQQPGSDSGSGSSSDHQPNPAPPATDNEQPGSDSGSGSSSDHQPNPAPPATDNEQPGSDSGSGSSSG
ncbi:hypothetical protein QVD17_37567 [Tagetes erecta]|uniref:Uncharacterized protein n=1 Tax=Tagetes erecta TaxID=13708 RepID=A0AAD8JW97_TARER|nr:hypothetical protein QVD17_37567 [Tagetes erecta]